MYECFKKMPKEGNPMDVLQAAVPLLAMDDLDLKDDTREGNYQMAIRLIARMPTLVSACLGVARRAAQREAGRGAGSAVC